MLKEVNSATIRLIWPTLTRIPVERIERMIDEGRGICLPGGEA